MIQFLQNLKLRRKLLIAMLPLALMVFVAGIYSSIESKKIDTRYSQLLDQDVSALHDLTQAEAEAILFGQLLYKEIAEPDADKMRVIEGELDQAFSEYQRLIAEALNHSPERTTE